MIESANEETGKVKNSFVKDIILKYIPLLLGIALWTRLKYNIFSLVQNHLDFFKVLSNLVFSNIILILICFMYGLFIYKKFGIVSVLWYSFKLIIFPIYIIGFLLYFLCFTMYSLFKGVGRIWKVLSNPALVLLFIGISILCWFIVTGNFNSIVFESAVAILPYISVVLVLWLYIWTFHPFNFFNGAIKVAGKVVNFLVKIDEKNYQSVFTRNTTNNLEVVDAAKKYNKELDDLIERLKKINSIIGDINIGPMIINIFVILFLIVAIIICLNFSYLYYAIYLHDPNNFKIDIKSVAISDFIMLSFRTLFFSDYVHLTPISGSIINTILFESVTGVIMFVLLITSFSMISAQQGKKYFKDLQIRLNNKIQTIKEKIVNIDNLVESALTVNDMQNNNNAFKG